VNYFGCPEFTGTVVKNLWEVCLLFFFVSNFVVGARFFFRCNFFRYNFFR
jgi:hypothetical protein